MLNVNVLNEMVGLEQGEVIKGVTIKHFKNDIYSIVVEIQTANNEVIYICGALNGLNSNDIDVMVQLNTINEANNYLNEIFNNGLYARI